MKIVTKLNSAKGTKQCYRLYGTDHTQCRIHLSSWVCLRLNNCRGRGRGTCFARKCTALSVLHDIRERNRCHSLFLAIIKPRANLRLRAGATLREICTVFAMIFIGRQLCQMLCNRVNNRIGI